MHHAGHRNNCFSFRSLLKDPQSLGFGAPPLEPISASCSTGHGHGKPAALPGDQARFDLLRQGLPEVGVMTRSGAEGQYV